MDLYDIIADELIHKKSLSALIYLIVQGREVEFLFNGKKYFISRDNSQKYVSFWDDQNEQGFDSMEELIEKAIVSGSTLLSVWNEIQIDIIF